MHFIFVLLRPLMFCIQKLCTKNVRFRQPAYLQKLEVVVVIMDFVECMVRKFVRLGPFP